ncbi:uncharacterized protein LOC134812938 [Bolinopsis microptera]|uniref:uncharacterized protein LOC134812938 n=1 Tax=Bolinopsis microptera TaxID=2820187 RepID=UPI00307A4F54
MSEKDYRATYLTSLGIQSRKTEILDIHADEIDLDKIKHYLLVTPSNKLNNRAQIWQFLLRITPRYKTVRLHTQEQLDEQWSVIENAARLILSVSSDHDTTHYLYALHLIHTGQLSLMNDKHDITCGNQVLDKCSVLLVKNIILLLESLKLKEQYFIIHEILLLFSSINKYDVVVEKIVSKISQTDSSLAKKFHSTEVKRVLCNSVRTCFVKALPSCCFGRLMDTLIAKRDASCLVSVGVEIVMKNAVINRNSAPADLAEEIKSTILVTQPHQSCRRTFDKTVPNSKAEN